MPIICIITPISTPSTSSSIVIAFHRSSGGSGVASICARLDGRRKGRVLICIYGRKIAQRFRVFIFVIVIIGRRRCGRWSPAKFKFLDISNLKIIQINFGWSLHWGGCIGGICRCGGGVGLFIIITAFALRTRRGPYMARKGSRKGRRLFGRGRRRFFGRRRLPGRGRRRRRLGRIKMQRRCLFIIIAIITRTWRSAHQPMSSVGSGGSRDGRNEIGWGDVWLWI